MKISPVLITKNAEATIQNTLKSLMDFSEVIILDTGSTDQTIAISSIYQNVKIYKTKFTGFGSAKNLAANLAKNDWILSIDADEVLSEELLESIKNERLLKDYIYKWERQNFYKGKCINYSGWGNEFVTRLYNRKSTAFNSKLVHESLEIKNLKVKRLGGRLLHYSYHSISDFTIKRDFYSNLFAIEYKGKRKSSPLIAIVKSMFDFLNTFIVRLGFLDGYRGLLIAVSNSYVTFNKYLKLYEMNIGFTRVSEKYLMYENSSNLIKLSENQLVNVVKMNDVVEVTLVKDKLTA